MNNHIITTGILCFFIGLGSAIAGTVNLLPISPMAGTNLVIEYKTGPAESNWTPQNETFHGVVLWFEEGTDLPMAEEVPLRFDGKRWTGEYTIPKNCVFLMVKIGDGKRYDNNGELYWNTLVYDAAGKPVRGASMKAAQSCLGQLPLECRRKQDLDEARDLLIEETKAYSKNIAAQVNLILLEGAHGVYSSEEGATRLRNLLQPGLVPATPDEALAVAAGFRAIQDEAEASRVLLNASQRFPRSKVSEQLELEEISRISNIDDYVGRVAAFIESYPQSPTRTSLIESVVTATTKQGSFAALIRFLEKVPDIPASFYYHSVNYIGAQDTLRPQAYRFVEAGLASASNPKTRVQWIGPSEWNIKQNTAKSQLYFVRGAIQRADGKINEAIASFKESVRFGGKETDKGVFEMLITVLEGNGNDPDVITYAELAMTSGAATPTITTSYVNAQMRKGMEREAANARVTSLKAVGQSAMYERIAKEMLHQPLVDGLFTSLSGDKTKISDWKGKVVIIDYWATWCGPCRKSFPSLQKLYEKYKDNPNVVFAVVNVWERDADRMQVVRDFLSKNPSLTFPMYLDLDDSVVQKYGVTGIPTKFFLGKDGRIQFKEVGLLPDEQFIDEASKKIDLLLSQ